MTQNIETFKTKCAKWKVAIERLMWILPLSFFVGFLAGFFGGRKDVLKSKLIDGINNFERMEFLASIVIPLALIYFYMFLTRNILAHFAQGEYFHQSVFKNIAKIGGISLIFGALIMPLALLVIMVIFSTDFSAFDVLITYVNGLDFISITLGLVLLLIGHALNVAKVYYEEQQLTI